MSIAWKREDDDTYMLFDGDKWAATVLWNSDTNAWDVFVKSTDGRSPDGSYPGLGSARRLAARLVREAK